MTFGEHETFRLIGRALSEGEETDYDSLCRIIYDDAGALLKRRGRGLSRADAEDVLQDIVCKVIRNLPRFYQQSADKSPGERNAWLRTIVENEKNNYYRAKTRELEQLEYDDAIGQYTEDDFVRRIAARDALLEALKGSFAIATTPEKIMAFVYNRLLGALLGRNGSPKGIVEEFEGVPLAVMYHRMTLDLSQALACSIPASVLAPLREKVEACPDRKFDLTPRTITDSSNWVVSKMKEQQKNG